MSISELASSHDLRQRLEAIVASAMELLSADGGAVILRGDQQLVVAAARGLSVAEVEAFQTGAGAVVNDEVLRTMQPVIHSGGSSRRGRHASPDGAIRACLSLPLGAKDRTIGTLQLYAAGKLETFHQEDIEVVGSLAREAALAIENTRLLLLERQQQRRASVVLEIARATTSTLKLEDVLEQVVEKTAILSGADRCSIWLLDRDGDHLISQSIYGIDEGFASRWRRQTLQLVDEILSREALATLEPVIVADAEGDPRTDKRAVKLFGDRSIVVMPLVYKDTPLGTLFLNHIREQHFYTVDEIETITAIASQAAVAIKNAQLYEESRQKSESLEASFKQIGMALASAVSTDDILQVVVDSVVGLLRAPYCGIQLLDDDCQELTFHSSRGIPPEVVRASRIRLGEGLGGRVLAARRALYMENLEGHDEMLMPNAKLLGIKSYIGVPLFVKGKAIGVLGVYSNQTRQLSEQDLELLRSFASQASVAMERAELFDETQRRAQDLTLLHDASMTINSSLELDKVLEVVVSSAMRLTDADIGSLFVIQEDTGRLVEAVTIPPDRSYGSEIRPHGLTSQILETAEGIIITDTEKDGRVNPAVIAKGIRSVLGMPVMVDEAIIGVLYLNALRPHHFSEANMDLLSVLANQTAVALKNAHLYDGVVKEKEKLAAIFQNSTDGILMMDDEGRIQALNLALERLIGWTTEEALGRPCSEVFGCQDMKGVGLCGLACPLSSNTRASDGVPYVELAVRRRDGETVHVAASCSEIPSPTGGSSLWVSIMRDITEAKRVEQLKSDFVAIVSHELRTPLSIIKGYSSTMLRPGLTFDQDSERRFISSIDEAANRLTRLMNDLLSISRIEMGKLELHVGRFDLNAAVRKMAQEVSFSHGNSHNIVLRLMAGGAFVQADRVRIEEVLQNLLDNAMKYSPPGSDVIIRTQNASAADTAAMRALQASRMPSQAAAVSLERTASAEALDLGHQQRVLLSVEDQGIGLNDEQRRHVFEKFYRGEGGLTRRTSGMGLGLFLSKGLVEAHGGEIWAEDNPSGGSIFHVALPVS